MSKSAKFAIISTCVAFLVGFLPVFWVINLSGLVALKNEESIFGDEIKKLKIYRGLWHAILGLLVLRVIVVNFLLRTYE